MKNNIVEWGNYNVTLRPRGSTNEHYQIQSLTLKSIESFRSQQQQQQQQQQQY